MAAGWHGSYRDHGSRVRESDVEVSRRKDYYQDSLRREGDRERSRSRDLRDRVDSSGASDGDRERSRSRDLRERVDSGGASGSGGKWSRHSGKPPPDREPGELSSGSESDHSDSLRSRCQNNEVSKQENGDSSTSNKKRKFSPIIWDIDADKRSSYVNSINKNDQLETVTLPPPPSLPHGHIQTGLVRQSTDHGLASNMKVSVDSPQDLHWGDDREPGKLEEEDEDDHAPARNISTSRWADNAIEGDGVDAETEEIMPKKRIMPLPNLAYSRSQREASSPELGELLRESSAAAASKSSSSEGEHKDGHREGELDKIDCMDVDIDGEDPTDVSSDYISDTDSEDDNGRSRTLDLANPPPRSINMLQGCRSVDEFERLNKIDEGTYGVVYRARDKKSGEIVALKKVKMEKEREGFPLTSLREINILLSFHHSSIVDVKEVVVGSSLDSIFMAMEYMEHDLKALMETMKQPFSQSEVKCLMLQLLDGVKYLHDNWVLHRDLKTSNLLLNNRGELKICDFGLSRQYGSPLKPYTQLVVTLWYRAPELLLGAKEYSTAIDMWSLGCIMAELLAKEPLFSGKTEFDQLDKIFRALGTPNEKIWPGFSKLPGVKVNFVKQPFNKLREKFPPTSFTGRPTLSEAGFDLLNELLTYDPEKRITAESALKHEWFHEVPLPKSKDFMPTFPAQHAQDRRLRRVMKSPDPLEEQRKKELQQGGLGTGSLFG